MPGWPLFACSTASAARKRMVLTATCSKSLRGAVVESGRAPLNSNLLAIERASARGDPARRRTARRLGHGVGRRAPQRGAVVEDQLNRDVLEQWRQPALGAERFDERTRADDVRDAGGDAAAD